LPFALLIEVKDFSTRAASLRQKYEGFRMAQQQKVSNKRRLLARKKAVLARSQQDKGLPETSNFEEDLFLVILYLTLVKTYPAFLIA
jgi:hypothetical protein